MITIEECKKLYARAVAKDACKGNIEAVARYIEAGDVEGCLRVARGNREWLEDVGIEVDTGDGTGEVWHDNGQQAARENWVGGELEGLCEEWYENGQLRVRSNWAGGKREGAREEWYSSGQLYSRENWAGGKPEGLCEVWYSSGQIRGRSNWAGGKLVAREEF